MITFYAKLRKKHLRTQASPGRHTGGGRSEWVRSWLCSRRTSLLRAGKRCSRLCSDNSWKNFKIQCGRNFRLERVLGIVRVSIVSNPILKTSCWETLKGLSVIIEICKVSRHFLKKSCRINSSFSTDHAIPPPTHTHTHPSQVPRWGLVFFLQ